MRSTIVNTCFCFLFLSFVFFCEANEKHKKPNVIFFLVDDMGWKDAGCYGSSFYETPALDQLAEEGVKFTNAYSAHPVCGPSRASILSGKAPLRLGNTATVGNLHSSEKTIAEAMKEGGYRTFFAGKWHVGMTNGRHPLDQGFDEAVGVNAQGQPGSYFFPYKDTGCDWPGKKRRVIPQRDVPGLENGNEGDYLTDRLTDETINFIKENKQKPFFVYLSHYAVHTPLEGKKSHVDYFRNKNIKSGNKDEAELEEIKSGVYERKNTSNPIYAAMIKSMDESLAKLMRTLKELKLDDNTIVVFTSDNGGVAVLKSKELNMPTSNSPLKYGKGWVYEGGIRVPAIIKYPPKIVAGTSSDVPVCHYDYFPTILNLAGIAPQPKQHLDGIDISPIFDGEKPSDRKMYWYYPHHHGSGHAPSAAIRAGNYKLIWHLEEERIELYDLMNDLSEMNDLSDNLPQKAKEMEQELKNWVKNTKPLK